MSRPEGDSRTAAVGRKRKAAGEYKPQPTSRASSVSSKESGEVSSSPESAASEDDSDIEEISADQWSKRQKTTHTAAASEEGQLSSDMDTSSNSDSDASVVEIPGPKPDHRNPTRIADLTPKERDAQERYFHLTSTTDLVRCLCCGERGHMAKTCPARTCLHCKQYDLHASNACPTFRKCGLCRERGHDARVCRNRAFRGPDPCDVCTETTHVEEECPYLWRISTKSTHTQTRPRAGFDANRSSGGLNYDEGGGGESPPPPPPPEREQRRPWQLMGMFDDGRD